MFQPIRCTSLTNWLRKKKKQRNAFGPNRAGSTGYSFVHCAADLMFQPIRCTSLTGWGWRKNNNKETLLVPTGLAPQATVLFTVQQQWVATLCGDQTLVGCHGPTPRLDEILMQVAPPAGEALMPNCTPSHRSRSEDWPFPLGEYRWGWAGHWQLGCLGGFWVIQVVGALQQSRGQKGWSWMRHWRRWSQVSQEWWGCPGEARWCCWCCCWGLRWHGCRGSRPWFPGLAAPPLSEGLCVDSCTDTQHLSRYIDFEFQFIATCLASTRLITKFIWFDTVDNSLIMWSTQFEVIKINISMKFICELIRIQCYIALLDHITQHIVNELISWWRW